MPIHSTLLPKRRALYRWLCISLLLLPMCAPAIGSSQRIRREPLTPEEIELVRDNQELDKRIAVFVKAAERRLLAVSSAASSKEAQKDAEAMGSLADSTRAQLLADVARILDEAITNIDDASIHNEKSGLIPKAMRKLVEAAGPIEQA